MLKAMYAAALLLFLCMIVVAQAQQLFIPCNQAFREDRASLHFFQSDEEYPIKFIDENGAYKFNPDDMSILQPYLRRGDILENVLSSGYRAQGLYIYDGEKVVELDDKLDDYGNIPSQFVVYRDFNPHYWAQGEMNYNNVLVPTQTKTQAYWHSQEHPRAYMHAPTILAAEGLEVNIQGQMYPIDRAMVEWLIANPIEKRERSGFVH